MVGFASPVDKYTITAVKWACSPYLGRLVDLTDQGDRFYLVFYGSYYFLGAFFIFNSTTGNL
jgi:hypothetical protein